MNKKMILKIVSIGLTVIVGAVTSAITELTIEEKVNKQIEEKDEFVTFEEIETEED